MPVAVAVCTNNTSLIALSTVLKWNGSLFGAPFVSCNLTLDGTNVTGSRNGSQCSYNLTSYGNHTIQGWLTSRDFYLTQSNATPIWSYELTNPLNITHCANLSIENQSYHLEGTVSAIGAGLPEDGSMGCINIQAKNITIDCRGNQVIGDNANAVYGIMAQYDNANNTELADNSTIKNCVIKDFYSAIEVQSKNVTALNNTIRTITFGISSQVSGDGINLTLNTINITNPNPTCGAASGCEAFFLETPTYGSIANNTVIQNGTNPITAIEFQPGTGALTITGNNVSADQWVVDELASGLCIASLNDSASGNIWQYANGTGAWVGRSIFALIGSYWATAGADVPISSTTFPAQFATACEDHHPYTLNLAPYPQNFSWVKPSANNSNTTNSTYEFEWCYQLGAANYSSSWLNVSGTIVNASFLPSLNLTDNGGACTSDSQCLSGNCAQNVCSRLPKLGGGCDALCAASDNTVLCIDSIGDVCPPLVGFENCTNAIYCGGITPFTSCATTCGPASNYTIPSNWNQSCSLANYTPPSRPVTVTIQGWAMDTYGAANGTVTWNFSFLQETFQFHWTIPRANNSVSYHRINSFAFVWSPNAPIALGCNMSINTDSYLGFLESPFVCRITNVRLPFGNYNITGYVGGVLGQTETWHYEVRRPTAYQAEAN